jgi:regulatory protein
MVKNRIQQIEGKKITPAEGLIRIYRFCAYQERSHLEVKNKLFSFGLWEDAVNEILSRLIVEGFLNEERFAKAFTGGKFRIKKWGKNKIIHALEGKGLTETCIQRGLMEIEDPDYKKTLIEIIRKKLDRTHQSNQFRKREIVARYAIAKGFEPEFVWQVVKSVISD